MDERKILLLDPDTMMLSILTIREQDGKLYAQEEGHPEFEVLPDVLDEDEQAELMEVYLKQVIDDGDDYLGLIPEAAGKTSDEIRALAADRLAGN